MASPRVFLSQDTLDQWLGTDHLSLAGDRLTLPTGDVFTVRMAIHIVAEVSGMGDPHQLAGKVKDLEQVAELGGEHYADSLLVGDHAYQVVEGFVAEGGPPEAFRSILS